MVKTIYVYCYGEGEEISNKVAIDFSIPIELESGIVEDLDLILYDIFGPEFNIVDVEAEYT